MNEKTERGLRIVVLGGRQVGKSALTVRFLTRRFIGEYESNIDLIYTYNFSSDSTAAVEILDSCGVKQMLRGLPTESQIIWGDVFIVVYSITDRESFDKIPDYIHAIQRVKNISYSSIILIGNKRDLDHMRAVDVEDAQQMALEHDCHFYEISAAESNVGANLALQTALREARTIRQRKMQQKCLRRSRSGNGSLILVSKMLGSLFAKHSNSDKNGSNYSLSSATSWATLPKRFKRANSFSI